jgi:hypothetical protein
MVPMTRTLRVLLAGHSNLTFADAGPESSATALLRARLVDALPESQVKVECLTAPLIGSMATLLEDAVARLRPHWTVVTFLGTAFALDFVTNRIRRRWRRAYRLSLRLAEQLKRMSGDSTNAGGARSLVYRLPEFAAFTLIGGEPFVSTDRAVADAISALEALCVHEDMEVLCRLPGPTSGPSHRRYRTSARRIDDFNQRVAAFCSRRHIPGLRLDNALSTLGAVPRHAADGVHLDLRTRELEAQATAGIIVNSWHSVEVPAI